MRNTIQNIASAIAIKLLESIVPGCGLDWPRSRLTAPGPAAIPGFREAGRQGRGLEWASSRRVPAGLLLKIPGGGSIAPDEAHHFSLDADPVRPEDSRLVSRVGGFERD